MARYGHRNKSMALYGHRNESMALYGHRNESMALYGQIKYDSIWTDKVWLYMDR